MSQGLRQPHGASRNRGVRAPATSGFFLKSSCALLGSGSKPAQSSRCLLSPSCGALRPYNSRDGDNSYLTSTSDALDPKECEGLMHLTGKAALSAQPSGWIRVDPTPSCPATLHGGMAGGGEFGWARALPFTILSSAWSDSDHLLGGIRGVPSALSSLAGAGSGGPPASRLSGASGQQQQQHLEQTSQQLWTLTDQPGIDMFLAGPGVWGKLREGESLPQETIIAFESEEDAERYAGLLEATMAHAPYVCGIAPRELLDFCLDESYQCRLEPLHSLLIPPDCNVGMTDWERSLRLRDGQWAVLSSEPSDSCVAVSVSAAPLGLMLMDSPTTSSSSGSVGSAMAAAAAAATTNLQRAHAGGNLATLARYVGMSGGELDSLRARLDRILLLDS